MRRIFEDHGLPACDRVRDLDASPDGGSPEDLELERYHCDLRP